MLAPLTTGWCGELGPRTARDTTLVIFVALVRMLPWHLCVTCIISPFHSYGNWWSCSGDFVALTSVCAAAYLYCWGYGTVRFHVSLLTLILAEHWDNFCSLRQWCFRGGKKVASKGQPGWGSEGGWRTPWAACLVTLLTSSRGQQICPGQGLELERVGPESSLLWHTAIQIAGSFGHVATCSSTF